MTLVKHELGRRDNSSRSMDLFDRFFDDRLSFLRRPILLWPEGGDGVRLEEFNDEGTLVIRAELAGLDPEKDVEVSVKDQVLHISAERHEEEKSEGRDYIRREFHYGAFARDLPLPAGMTEADVHATYKDGILEIRIPMPTDKPGVKIPVSTT